MTDVLDNPEARCVLALPGPGGPLVTAQPFWYDGAALWLAVAGSGMWAPALARRPACAVLASTIGDAEHVTVVHGRARAYGLGDPLALALHGLPVSAAMTALALRQAGWLAAALRAQAAAGGSAKPQAGSWLRSRLALRVGVGRRRDVMLDPPAPDVAPALPAAVPADVRRALAGRRRIVVAAQHGDAVELVAGEWGAGFVLRLPSTIAAARVPAVAVVEAATAGLPAVGLALAGTIGRDVRLQPVRATWWRPGAAGEVDLSVGAKAASLPD